jgi:hypothetical protein
VSSVVPRDGSDGDELLNPIMSPDGNSGRPSRRRRIPGRSTGHFTMDQDIRLAVHVMCTYRCLTHRSREFTNPGLPFRLEVLVA